MSVTSISDKNKLLLWVKSGGRCQYRGCNLALYIDLLTKRNYNQAYIAHIIADSENGPRGDKIRSSLLADDIGNLMLLCDRHHRLIDKDDVPGHSEDLLLKMKREHEDRIERATAISANMQSHIIIYRANVGKFTPEISYKTSSYYLLPEMYPAYSDAIDLGLSNSVQRDRDISFWTNEVENLEAQFSRKILQSFAKGEIKHLSIFAFAPIPLLIRLGTLINDIYDAEIYQPVRSPRTWKLDNEKKEITYEVIEAENDHPIVAINISLSATINNERIIDVLGYECSIYSLTINNPFNDFLKSKIHLEDFSVSIRKLLNLIKSKYNSQTSIHLFPAMPIATAIEFGRVWMPKADMPLVIYDENTANGGFMKAIEIYNS